MPAELDPNRYNPSAQHEQLEALDSEYIPAAQEYFEASRQYEPASQATHPALLYWPAGQVIMMQLDEHDDEVWPFGHVTQVPEELDPDRYAPAAQHEQLEAMEPEYFPEEQEVQLEALDPEYIPAAHEYLDAPPGQ